MQNCENISFVIFAFRPLAWKKKVLTGRISTKFGIWEIFKILSKKITFFTKNLTSITDTLQEGFLYIYGITSLNT